MASKDNRATGPRTLEGRAISRRNALRHGLTATALLLPDERLEDFEALAEGIRSDLRPVGTLEEFFVERIVAAAWRLKRVLRAEAKVFAWKLDADPFGAPTLGTVFVRDGDGDTFGKLSRYETTLERGLTSALHELQRLQAARGGEKVLPPVVLDVAGFVSQK